MTTWPRAINSSAIAEDLITCPAPMDREASARKTYLIVVKGMLYALRCGDTAQALRRFVCRS